MEQEISHIITRVDRIGDRRDDYRRDLRKHRLTPPLLLVLRLLEGDPGMTMVELSRRLGASVPTMQSRINRLERLGLVNRSRCRSDRRKMPTELSPRGRAMLRRVPLAGAGRLLDALENGEVTPRKLRRLAEELDHVERLLFPADGPMRPGRKTPAIWRR